MSIILMKSEKECWGDYYGYQKCCIREFHRMLSEGTKFKEISKERQTAKKNGFVPCQRCAEQILKGEKTAEDCILPSRKCPKPFSGSLFGNY